MVTARIQTYTDAIIPAVLFGLGVLISAGMTTTADSQAVVDQEKINRQLEQVVKALDSGDIAAAEKYLNEIEQGLPTGQAKTHVAIAINSLLYSNSTEGARMHIQIVQSSLQNSTG
jgi:outer membrane protein assembly factor BamD (BamD/ComL family)